MNEFKLPDPGEGLLEADIVSWKVAVGDTVAQAYRRLYKLERVCRAQLVAMATGQPLALLSDEMVEKVDKPNPKDTHPRAEREQLYFEAMMRVLDRELPGYAD